MVCSVKRIPVQRAGRALIQEVSESCFYAQSSPHILKPSLSITGGDLALCMIKIRLQREELQIVAYAARIVFAWASHPSTTMLQPQAYRKCYKDSENDILDPPVTTLSFERKRDDSRGHSERDIHER